MRVTVLGPTRSGKTVYLASLLRAGFSVRRATRPIVVRADPRSAAAVALDENATAVLTGRRLPATSDASSMELFADLPGSILFGIGKETLQISMVDVPGGACMPAPGSAIDESITHAIAESDALLVVVPADADARPPDFTDRLRHLVRATHRPERKTAFPFLRIAVVMTMAELLVADRGVRALSALEALDGEAEVAKACEGLLPLVRSLVPPGGDWYSLVSAYGFDIRTGEIASERSAGGWRLKTDGRPFRDDWYPFRAFEPLEFLARGVCWREAS